MDDEVIFVVEEASDGGFTARALGYSIVTEADTRDELCEAVRDAVELSFRTWQIPTTHPTSLRQG